MSKPFLLFFVFAFYHSLYTQTNSFDGSIAFNDKHQHDCQIEIKIDSDFVISGHSIRITHGKNITRVISGQYYPENTTVYIREFATSKTDCPIFIQANIYNIIQNIYAIAGIFQTFDSTRCGSGHINIINKDFIFPKIKKENQPIITISENEQNEILNTLLKANIKKEKNFIQVKHNEKISIKTKKDTIYLKIYDNQKVDGDRVKIEFNEMVVIDNYPLSDEERVFKLIPKKGKNILRVYATNEGRIPLNTSKVELYNNNIQEYFINVLHKNEFTTYEFEI